jgi:hypothetical protein
MCLTFIYTKEIRWFQKSQWQLNIKTISRHCDVESQKKRCWRQNLWVTDNSHEVRGNDFAKEFYSYRILITALLGISQVKVHVTLIAQVQRDGRLLLMPYFYVKWGICFPYYYSFPSYWQTSCHICFFHYIKDKFSIKKGKIKAEIWYPVKHTLTVSVSHLSLSVYIYLLYIYHIYRYIYMYMHILPISQSKGGTRKSRLIDST